jgi:hypothetical protein
VRARLDRLADTLGDKMSAAERWCDAHGFPVAGMFENADGERLDELLEEAEDVTFEGSVWPRWRFPDGSSVVARFGSWDIEGGVK